MLNLEEIKSLIQLIDKSSVDKFTYEVEGNRISISKHKQGETVVTHVAAPQSVQLQAPAPIVQTAAPQATEVAIPVAAPKVENDNCVMIKSPMVGTFYSSPSPDKPVFVSEGSTVSANTVVCIVEAMKLFNEIEAEVSGEIVEVLVTNGQLVEFDQPLFKVKPSR
ncbi:MAG: acetyl-CoA carboxylase biotin carboxyl carrier protein [Bacilli bacterium]